MMAYHPSESLGVHNRNMRDDPISEDEKSESSNSYFFKYGADASNPAAPSSLKKRGDGVKTPISLTYSSNEEKSTHNMLFKQIATDFSTIDGTLPLTIDGTLPVTVDGSDPLSMSKRTKSNELTDEIKVSVVLSFNSEDERCQLEGAERLGSGIWREEGEDEAMEEGSYVADNEESKQESVYSKDSSLWWDHNGQPSLEGDLEGDMDYFENHPSVVKDLLKQRVKAKDLRELLNQKSFDSRFDESKFEEYEYDLQFYPNNDVSDISACGGVEDRRQSHWDWGRFDALCRPTEEEIVFDEIYEGMEYGGKEETKEQDPDQDLYSVDYLFPKERGEQWKEVLSLNFKSSAKALEHAVQSVSLNSPAELENTSILQNEEQKEKEVACDLEQEQEIKVTQSNGGLFSRVGHMFSSVRDTACLYTNCLNGGQSDAATSVLPKAKDLLEGLSDGDTLPVFEDSSHGSAKEQQETRQGSDEDWTHFDDSSNNFRDNVTVDSSSSGDTVYADVTVANWTGIVCADMAYEVEIGLDSIKNTMVTPTRAEVAPTWTNDLTSADKKAWAKYGLQNLQSHFRTTQRYRRTLGLRMEKANSNDMTPEEYFKYVMLPSKPKSRMGRLRRKISKRLMRLKRRLSKRTVEI